MKLTYEEMLLAQFDKEKQNDNSWLSFNSKAEEKDNISTRLSAFNFLYCYPEVFRVDLNPKKVSKQSLFKNLNDKIDFILNTKNTKKFSVRTMLEVYDSTSESNKKIHFMEFEEDYINRYLNVNSDFEPVEKTICKQEGGFVNKDESKHFRQLSFSNILISQLENIIYQDDQNVKKYTNIVFTGGILNCQYLRDTLEADIRSMTKMEKGDELNFFFPDKDENDTSIAFYKGANYLTKLPDLENIMISKENYMDYGKENLSYFYV